MHSYKQGIVILKDFGTANECFVWRVDRIFQALEHVYFYKIYIKKYEDNCA
jgi:hypothetical protein